MTPEMKSMIRHSSLSGKSILIKSWKMIAFSLLQSTPTSFSFPLLTKTTQNFIPSTIPSECSPIGLWRNKSSLNPGTRRTQHTFLTDKNTNIFDPSENSDRSSAKIDKHGRIGYPVTVSYDGLTCDIIVQSGETILAALERNGVSDLLCLTTVPHECRRGNCLTCTGAHREGSNTSNLVRGEDGLAPKVSKDAKGFVLTCSSYVVGEGVKLDLGLNHEAWDELYSDRLKGDDADRIGLEAIAKLHRLTAENNIQKWREELEKQLK
mmetsp:Transcript_37878/g.55810  ORF Transcript_37878/g.55810 Transcript_37878/m.55810 type:complete len:265 (-) Transcript_37878:405-1199(-)